MGQHLISAPQIAKTGLATIIDSRRRTEQRQHFLALQQLNKAYATPATTAPISATTCYPATCVRSARPNRKYAPRQLPTPSIDFFQLVYTDLLGPVSPAVLEGFSTATRPTVGKTAQQEMPPKPVPQITMRCLVSSGNSRNSWNLPPETSTRQLARRRRHRVYARTRSLDTTATGKQPTGRNHERASARVLVQKEKLNPPDTKDKMLNNTGNYVTWQCLLTQRHVTQS